MFGPAGPGGKAVATSPHTSLSHVPSPTARHSPHASNPPAWLPAGLPALQDQASQVQYWMLMLCDPKAWTPGHKETAGIGRERGYTKDRNLHLR